jgi:hypothetical protein
MTADPQAARQATGAAERICLMTDQDLDHIRERIVKTSQGSDYAYAHQSNCDEYQCECHRDMPMMLAEIERLRQELAVEKELHRKLRLFVKDNDIDRSRAALMAVEWSGKTDITAIPCCPCCEAKQWADKGLHRQKCQLADALGITERQKT